MRVTGAALLATAGRASALILGLMLAVLLGRAYLTGDCWAASDTPEAIRQCEIDKGNGMLVFIALAAAMWVGGVMRARRGARFARRLTLLSGPVAFLVSSVLF